MTRVVVVFEDATALVGETEADALGERTDLPFLTEGARFAAARRALADGNREAAEAIVKRGVIAPSSDDQIFVTFVEPPDWDRFGAALWDENTGVAHSVFASKLMIVDGVAVPDCVGASFADDNSRKLCALWCLRNGLEDIAARVANTPIGGDGPHCTWPDEDLPTPVEVQVEPKTVTDEELSPHHEQLAPNGTNVDPDSNVVSLFGGVFPQQIR